MHSTGEVGRRSRSTNHRTLEVGSNLTIDMSVIDYIILPELTTNQRRPEDSYMAVLKLFVRAQSSLYTSLVPC